MKNWTEELTTEGKSLAEVKIQRSIFQRDALLPFLFALAMMLLNYILMKCPGGYKFTKLQEKIYKLMNTGDIKLFAKNEKELETLIFHFCTLAVYSNKNKNYIKKSKERLIPKASKSSDK